MWSWNGMFWSVSTEHSSRDRMRHLVYFKLLQINKNYVLYKPELCLRSSICEIEGCKSQHPNYHSRVHFWRNIQYLSVNFMEIGYMHTMYEVKANRSFWGESEILTGIKTTCLSRIVISCHFSTHLHCFSLHTWRKYYNNMSLLTCRCFIVPIQYNHL